MNKEELEEINRSLEIVEESIRKMVKDGNETALRIVRKELLDILEKL